MTANLMRQYEAIARVACERNDTTLMGEAISLAAKISYIQKEEILSFSLRRAIQFQSVDILNYLLLQGANIKELRGIDVSECNNSSKEILEILLAHGWDLNSRYREGMPFMWYMVPYDNMVQWCLDHGASVHPQGQEPLRGDILTWDQRNCPTILERTASSGTVASFKLLKAKGAPLGLQTLHLAVEAATYPWFDRPERIRLGQREGEKVDAYKKVADNGKAGRSEEVKKDVNPAQTYTERMAMVRYLVDVVGLDVNGPDQPPGKLYPRRNNGNSLCYVEGGIQAFYLKGREVLVDPRELTWFLLDRGADPSKALQGASARGNMEFLHAVEEWQVRHSRKSWSKCSIQ